MVNSEEQIIQSSDYLTFTACFPSTFSLLDGSTSLPISSATPGLKIGANGQILIDVMKPISYDLRIKYLYDGTFYTTNAFKVTVACMPIVANTSISDY